MRAIDRERDMDAIGGAFPFHGLKAEELRRLLSAAGVTVASYAKGAKIYTPDGYRRALGIILSGTALVEKVRDGSRLLVSTLSAGDVFGAAILFTDAAQYVVEITAAEDAEALLIPEEIFLRMLRQNAQIAENYIRYLTGRIRFLSERLDGFVCMSAEERLYHYLCQNAVDGFVPVRSMTKLAEAVHVGRATLYRAVDTLVLQQRIVRTAHGMMIQTEGIV